MGWLNVSENVSRESYLVGEHNVQGNVPTYGLLLAVMPPAGEEVAGEGDIEAAQLERGGDNGSWGYAGSTPSLGRLALRSIICSPEWTWPCWWARGVVACESSWQTHVVNPAGPYVGLFQVLNGSTDPMTNARQAHQQFREWMEGKRQTSPWPGCSPERP